MLNCDLTLLGFRLRNARKECGLTQKELAKVFVYLAGKKEAVEKELAKQTGLSVKTIQDIEKGRKSPSYKTVLRLMSRLGVSPNTAFLIKEPTSTEKIQFFLEYFQSCDPKSQDILLKTLYFLAEQLRNFHDESN